MKRLFGIHMTPPDVAVVPPTSAAFSRISTRLPAARNTSAAQNEPAPLPTMMKSWVSLMAFSFCSNQNRGARYRSPRVPHAQRAVYRGDRKSVVEGKSGSVRVDVGGRGSIKKKKEK